MFLLRSVFAISAMAMMSCAGSASAPLTGQWGGDHVRLMLDAAGGRIEQDCGAGTIDAPLVLDAKGGFNVVGKFEAFSSGPTDADAAPAIRPADYRGTVSGDRMSLTLRVSGDKALRTFTLVRGQPVKLVRCL